MSEYDWLNLNLGYGGDMAGAGVMAPGDAWAGGSPTFNEGASFWDMGGAGVLAPQPGSLSWADANTWTPYGGWNAGAPGSGVFSPEWQQSGQDVSWAQSHPGSNVAGAPGAGWLQSILGSFGGLSGVLGPALSAGGAIAGGAIGSNAANDAARLQSEALNRGIDLQTAQWLQQQGNLAPYLQAGQQGLSQLQQLAGREPPSMQSSYPTQVNRQWYDYGIPAATPGWQPQTYQGPGAPQAQDYRWNPQQGPSAQDYRYTPGQLPQASQYGYQGPQAVQAGDFSWQPGQGPRAQDYRYTPGQTPDAAAYRYTPGAVPTLSGQELLANDPGVAFRQSEARKALEGSAAARGDLLSGGTLQALQSRSQDLASQEYGQAWNRAAQQAQMREQWGQQATAQNFGQAMSAAQLREQVQQTAQQMGWSQAQAEAAFREGMAQQASQQGFAQALGAQGQEWQQGMAGQQFDWQRAQAEAQLREQVNQQASQQGWSQAQAEAVFREQMGQQASQQGWNQALGGQQNQFTQGLQAQQWNQGQQQAYDQQRYQQMLQQNELMYGRDFAENQTNYEREQARYRQQLAQYLLPWEQASTLAGLGSKATGQFGEQGAYTSRGISDLLSQLGTAQGQGAAGQGLMWNRAITGATNQLPSILAGLNA